MMNKEKMRVMFPVDLAKAEKRILKELSGGDLL